MKRRKGEEAMDWLRMVTLTPGKAQVIALPKTVASRELLVDGRVYQIKLGLRKAAAALSVYDDAGYGDRPLEIRISPDVLSNLRLIPGLRYNLKVDRLAGTIAFGPVVGILAHPRTLEHLKRDQPTLGAQYHGLAAWDAHVVLYYFSPQHIDWENLTTHGWVNTDGRWSRHEVPLPDVVYDLAFGFSAREKNSVKYVRSRLRKTPGVQFVNSRDYLGKWWLFERLSDNREIRRHLPVTVQYRQLDDLAHMLGRHNQVFMKSYYGNRGEQVLSVEKAGTDSYVCRTFNKKVWARNLEEVHSIARDFFDTDKIIVQQGISLLKHEGRRLDMRVLLHKDVAGQWCETYNQVWVASEGSVITTNGAPVPFMSVMPAVLGSRDEAMTKQEEITKLCILISKGIESEYGPFGEIGLDVALDQHGRIWFLEANAKPSKNPQPFEGSGLLPQFTRIFEYSRFLSGFVDGLWRIGE